MRTRIALLVAAAAVFAPGWGTEPQAPSTSGVAGRILAPAFEEASVAPEHGAARGFTTWDRSKPVSLWSNVSARPSHSSAPFALQLVGAAVAVVVLLGPALRTAPSSPRAPPYVTV